ncbi:MAG: hypothetical protein M3N48_07670, partial [Verrucomicrobiota bacterium]|nr:hypothetical protein [Verrucomicrobiota bacterium]
DYNPADDYVTFVASGATSEQFSSLLKWDTASGEDVPGAPNKRRVKRNVARNNILRVLTQDGDREVTRLNVWIVSASISRTSSTSPAEEPKLNGTFLRATVESSHTVLPAEVISAADHPALDETFVDGAPGGPVLCAKDPKKGANRDWDVSRQVYLSISKNRSFSADTGCDAQTFTVFPRDNVLGNDDGSTTGEINNPYTNDGKLVDTDNPSSLAGRFDGEAGDWIKFTHHFREFTRLRVNGIWYRISPFYNYQLDLKFNKTTSGWIPDDSSDWTFSQ